MRQKKDLSFSAAFFRLSDSLLLQLISIHLIFPRIVQVSLFIPQISKYLPHQSYLSAKRYQ